MENDIEKNVNDEKLNEKKFEGVRSIAIKTLSRFERSDSYLDKLLFNEIKHNNLNSLDKSLLTELVNGVIRWKDKLDWVLVGFYHGDYLKCLNIVKNSMRVALYQILFLEKIPLHAAVNESVEVIKKIQGEKTAGIVNAVLRNISRNIENIRYPVKEDDVIYYLSVMYSFPRWMVRRWVDRFGGEETERLLFASNKRPHIPIRVNTLKSTTEEIEEILTERGVIFYRSQYLPNSIIVKFLRFDITTLDIFKEGKITIQDTSASLAALLAKPEVGSTVLDLCAAPGGKSFCLAEQMQDKGRVLAIDKYYSKLTFINDGAERLGLKSISTLVADSLNFEIGDSVDVVFADVPCSGLGTLSKKPDIKWKREREDIFKIADYQKEIINAASKLVKLKGVLVYSTCTIEPEENIENIEWFLKEHPNFEIDPAEKYLPEAVCKDGFMQTFSHIHHIDGAFAARLIRKE